MVKWFLDEQPWGISVDIPQCCIEGHFDSSVFVLLSEAYQSINSCINNVRDSHKTQNESQRIG